MSTDTNAAKPRYEISIGYLENTDQWNVHEITRLAGFEANWSQVVVHSSENLIEGYDYDVTEFEIHFSPEMVTVEHDGTSRKFGVGTPVFDKCVQLGIYQPVPDQPLAKPPLTIADLTEEQVILIAILAFGADFEMGEHFIRTGNNAVVIDFKVGGDGHHRVSILYDFDVSAMIWRGDEWAEVHVCNQRAIQKLFTEWGA